MHLHSRVTSATSWLRLNIEYMQIISKLSTSTARELHIEWVPEDFN